MSTPTLATTVAPRDATTPDLTAAIQALTHNMAAYKKAASYYEGKISEVFASVRLRRAMLRTGVAFVFNFARLAVDSIAERVALSTITATPDNANQALGEVWDRSKMKLTAKTIMRNALKYGDAYAIVWPDENGDVEIFYNSPQAVRVFYDTENPRKKTYAIKRWQLPDKRIRVDLFYPDRIEKYVQVGSGTHVAWQQWRDQPEDQWPYPHDLGGLPVFHFRTEEPYGCPEHSGFYGPQDAIHKLIVSHMASVDYQAFPQRYALVHPDSDTSEPADADEDEFAFASDTGSTEPAADGRSQFQADPGSVWYMQGIQGVGQFQVADPTVFTAPMMTYLRMGAQITNTPLYRIDPSGNIPSGDSRRVAEMPFLAKCEDREISFEDTWQELCMFACRVAGSPATSIDVQWRPLMTTDDLAGWQTVKAKLDAGLPPRQVFREAGYSDDQITEWFGEEDDDLDASVDLLAKIAGALASLGTAVSLGAVSDAQVQALIAAIIGDPDDDGVADIMDAGDANDAVSPAAAGVLGQLIRAGATPDTAAAAVGIDGLDFPQGVLPVTLRPPFQNVPPPAGGWSGDGAPPSGSDTHGGGQ